MANHSRTELVLDALAAAVAQRRPRDGSITATKDRNIGRWALNGAAREAGVRPSMGSVGDTSDNAMCESFFATLEYELLARCRFVSQAGRRMR